jgi:hypothetical protein
MAFAVFLGRASAGRALSLARNKRNPRPEHHPSFVAFFAGALAGRVLPFARGKRHPEASRHLAWVFDSPRTLSGQERRTRRAHRDARIHAYLANDPLHHLLTSANEYYVYRDGKYRYRMRKCACTRMDASGSVGVPHCCVGIESGYVAFLPGFAGSDESERLPNQACSSYGTGSLAARAVRGSTVFRVRQSTLGAMVR